MMTLPQMVWAFVDPEAFLRLWSDFPGWAIHNRVFLLCVVSLLVGFVIGRTRVRRDIHAIHAGRATEYQNRGEALLSRSLHANFGPPNYHLMNHVTLRMQDGTTQIDHILVSRFGVFVIETKHFKGWIFANPKDEKWTQVLFHDRFRFQNPIFQNLRHVRAVQGLLDFLAPEVIKSVVVFTGDAEFRTEIPKGVFSIPGLVDHLRQHTAEVMSADRMQLCVGRLETARLAISGETDVEHVRNLERRFGNPASLFAPRVRRSRIWR